jgi:tetratricopeptide (TPR) repeat protein
LGDGREVAVGKGSLGNVLLEQRRSPEALAAYEEARERFSQLREPGSVAIYWHQTGITYHEMGDQEAAEEAYRKALSIFVQTNDASGQARTPVQMGGLYDDLLDRPEEAVALYRQAADKYIQIDYMADEGRAWNNLGETLHRLQRLDEARQVIHRAIECYAPYGHSVQPWTAWSVLTNIETDAGNPDAAAEARQQAVTAYLAYRRDGGENYDIEGRVALDVTQALLTGEAAAIGGELQQVADDPETPDWLQPFIQALQAIVAGSRDRRLAEAPEFDLGMAAEILLLIETLEKVEQGDHPSR